MDNKISFKSKIQFVDYSKFRRIIKDGCAFIEYKTNTCDILSCSDFYTENIRTCSAGGFVKPIRRLFSPFKKALGFHFLNNKKNLEHTIPRLQSALNFTPSGGLLIGGKKLYEKNGKYSLLNFEKIKTFMGSVLPDFSFFQQQRYLYGQTHIHYSLSKDTWTICSEINGENNLKGLPNKCVSTVEDLSKHFKKIHIAKQDSLFIGDKEITKSEAPYFFTGSR